MFLLTAEDGSLKPSGFSLPRLLRKERVGEQRTGYVRASCRLLVCLKLKQIYSVACQLNLVQQLEKKMACNQFLISFFSEKFGICIDFLKQSCMMKITKLSDSMGEDVYSY